MDRNGDAFFPFKTDFQNSSSLSYCLVFFLYKFESVCIYLIQMLGSLEKYFKAIWFFVFLIGKNIHLVKLLKKKKRFLRSPLGINGAVFKEKLHLWNWRQYYNNSLFDLISC